MVVGAWSSLQPLAFAMTPFVLLALVFIAILWPSHSSAAMQPVADPRSIVLVGNARFTVLTPSIVRLE